MYCIVRKKMICFLSKFPLWPLSLFRYNFTEIKIENYYGLLGKNIKTVDMNFHLWDGLRIWDVPSGSFYQSAAFSVSLFQVKRTGGEREERQNITVGACHLILKSDSYRA